MIRIVRVQPGSLDLLNGCVLGELFHHTADHLSSLNLCFIKPFVFE
jgi:hypothetical protein